MTTEEEKKQKLQERYGKSEHGNFYVVDTIGVPHPYCIGPAHVNHAQKFGGMLSRECIEDGEKKKLVHCMTPRCNLPLAGHEQALLVACTKDMKTDEAAKSELEAYLKSIVARCEEDKYAGFAFLDRR